MEISSVSHSPVSEVSSPVMDKVSAFDTEHKLIDAFQNLDFQAVTELVNQGGNPDQSIPLSKAIVVEFVRQNFETQEVDGEVTPLNIDAFAILIENNPEQYQACINEFFNGEIHHPILLLSALISSDDLCLSLLEKGANPAFKGDAEGHEVSILDIAARKNLLKTAAYAIQEKGMMPNQPMNEGFLSPFSLALLQCNEEVLRLFLETAPDNLDLFLFEIEGFTEAWNDNAELAPIRALFEEYGVEIPKV